jgi:DNA-binding transcriptional ArsR family regulator
MTQPRLNWDISTAYDLFVSLEVLHDPATYGVRGVWAAGMRSRLPAPDRDFLERTAGTVISVPFAWLLSLPEPRDGAAALAALNAVPAGERLAVLYDLRVMRTGAGDILRDVQARGAWNDADLDAFMDEVRRLEGRRFRRPRKDFEALLEAWADPAVYGEKLGRALRAYYDAFFVEEERRIYPALRDALARGQTLAARLSIPELVEELSQGISLEPVAQLEALTLAPSYWISPLIYWYELAPGEMMMLYGARPPDASLVPGEVVPDSLVLALKALADPTRLKIMHYLSTESLTPTQLSRRLRLRAPTVVHHLQTLRVAGLVQITVAEGKERSYALRAGMVEATYAALLRFLEKEAPPGRRRR